MSGYAPPDATPLHSVHRARTHSRKERDARNAAKAQAEAEAAARFGGAQDERGGATSSSSGVSSGGGGGGGAQPVGNMAPPADGELVNLADYADPVADVATTEANWPLILTGLALAAGLGFLIWRAR